jgi:thiamine-phosphate pyrophosphorylase
VTPLPDPRLLVITDRKQTGRSVEDVAAAVFAGGCRWLSLREKDMGAAERTALLYRLVALGEHWRAVVSVHDDVDAALAAGAGAIHLSQARSVGELRQYFGADRLIGISAHDMAEVERAASAGADYVTLSPIFASASKPGYGPPLGLGAISEIAQRVPIPIVALGGIDDTTAASCMAAGATGVAVMGAAMRAADPEAMIRQLIASMGDGLAVEGAPEDS